MILDPVIFLPQPIGNARLPGMAFKKELHLHLRSRFTMICVVSYEEEVLLEKIEEVCDKGGRRLYTWDHADFFQARTRGAPIPDKARDPLSALEEIDKATGKAVYVLRDFHQCWRNQPRVIRKLRNLAQKLKRTKKTIIITMPTDELPRELKDDAVIMHYHKPAFAELEDILNDLLRIPGVRVELTADERTRLLRAALGLSSNQAQRVFAKAIVSGGRLNRKDIELVMNEKRQLIRESGALEFYSVKETIADVGGLGLLKHWLKTRQRAFGSRARKFGLPEPKGLVLIGIPGTGKSLTAKMIAAMWGMPLVRLDVGALYGGLVGESEANTRQALHLAEAIAPCVLWIDEIEKALATGSGAGDSGTSMRVFGNILSWMQDKYAPVFVVATANDISRLPPELLRRGRFDEIFFLDLPTREERKKIFSVHIRKRGRDPEKYDLDRLAAASEGYVGAEMEQAVIDGLYLAFNDETDRERDLTTDDIICALGQQVPMSRSQKENVDGLRRWLAEGRARSASFAEDEEPVEDATAIAAGATPSIEIETGVTGGHDGDDGMEDFPWERKGRGG